MALRYLFSAFAAVMFKPGFFWAARRDGPYNGMDAIREYALPLIAMVQLLKFPIIGEPRPAMFYALFCFSVDVAVLLLLSGIGSKRRTEQGLAAFTLTPFWVAEPFFLFTGSGWIFALCAVCYVLLLQRFALSRLGESSGYLLAVGTVFVLLGAFVLQHGGAIFVNTY
ncbi:MULTISPECIES: hypothetical protein [Prosthecochloris]|nr:MULTISPECIES: hypothetical protein [Prosthecochloris]